LNDSGRGEFVAIFENLKWGWFGIQSHPEKAKYEFGRPEGFSVSNYFKHNLLEINVIN